MFHHDSHEDCSVLVNVSFFLVNLMFYQDNSGLECFVAVALCFTVSTSFWL